MKLKQTNNTRAVACQWLLQVVAEGKSFSPQSIASFSRINERDKAFIIYLCFGVLRFYPRLQEWMNRFLNKPLKTKDTDLQLLMMLGLYQLFYTQTPAYAALNETVAATKDLGKPWAKGLINHVLHEALRQEKDLQTKNSFVANTAHPLWLAKALKEAWPDHWQNIIEANLAHPPFALRVNTRKISVELYLQRLQEAKISAQPIDFCPEGLLLSQPLAVEKLPGFAEGLISVQDGAAQLAVSLLDLKPHLRVLDACAAPGGKMAHILEKEPLLTECLAVEKDPERMTLLQNTLKRLTLKATLINQDALVFAEQYQGEPFDRILLDAPCSATGVIRRHPDIKLHRTWEDVEEIVLLQQQLLNKLWPLLKTDGILVYATCSILPQENSQQIAQFLFNHPDAKATPLVKEWGIAQRNGRQILPGQSNMDGFYYAVLQKSF